MNSGVLKHGRYSKYLPAQLLPRLNEALNDPDLLELRQEIALIDTRLGMLLDNVDRGDSQEIWDSLVKAQRKFKEERAKGDLIAAGEHLNVMIDLIEKGGTDLEVWREIHTILEQRRRFVESETKRLVSQDQIITLEQAALLFRALSSAVTLYVRDRAIMERIQTEFDRILTTRDPADSRYGGPAIGSGAGAAG